MKGPHDIFRADQPLQIRFFLREPLRVGRVVLTQDDREQRSAFFIGDFGEGLWNPLFIQCKHNLTLALRLCFACVNIARLFVATAVRNLVNRKIQCPVNSEWKLFSHSKTA